MALLHGNRSDEKLLTVFEIARILASEHDLDVLAPRLLSSLAEMLKASAGILMLYDPAEARLRVKAAYGYDLAVLAQLRLAPGESTTGKAFQSGQPQVCVTPEACAASMANMTLENRQIFDAATTGLRPTRTVSTPLIAGQNQVGVLVLESLGEPGAFGPEDLPFLQAIADLLALSLENSRLNEELRMTQALSEANRLKAELISTLAHEMRTPLTSIKGYSTALLMEETAFSPQTQREFLEIIDEECDTLARLIHDLLESSIIDAGFLKLELQPVMLSRLVTGVVEELAHHSQKHRFLVDFSARLPIVDADPSRIEQVLRNLLDNAVKYSPSGGVIIVRGEAGADEVVVSVADQGVGIAPEHLNRLFEKFFRIKSALGRHVVGTGLGLPIARTIVEGHGGRIWAESTLGQGTTLYFTLPLTHKSMQVGQPEDARNE